MPCSSWVATATPRTSRSSATCATPRSPRFTRAPTRCSGWSSRESSSSNEGGRPGFGQSLEVEQLTTGHHQVAHREDGCVEGAGCPGDLEQQFRHVSLRYQYIGRDHADDARRQLCFRGDREDAPELVAGDGGEGITGFRCREIAQLLR